MKLLESPRYQALLGELTDQFPHWAALEGKSLLITGASGMIGSLLVDAVMTRNDSAPPARRCRILATSRSEGTARERFARWLGREDFFYLAHDVTQPFPHLPELPDYLLHAASTTHPAQYVAEPINTVMSNILGCRNMLDLAAQKPGSRMLLLSSVEVYGENRGDADYFDESYCGYLDCNTLRAGYPEAKRLSESLCRAYEREKGTDAVILRLPRTYGPTMRMSDTKAIAQFIQKALAGEDIVLKSKGDQLYSYAFVSDAVSGILWALTRGERGGAYNLADPGSDLTLKELAGLLAQAAGTKVVFDLPSEAERAGYSTATKALLDPGKLNALGWRARYHMADGLRLTLEMLRDGN